MPVFGKVPEGDPRTGGATKPCDKCGNVTPVEGGVQRTRTKWWCGACWRGFAMRPKKKTNK
jgi:hypothetical protein